MVTQECIGLKTFKKNSYFYQKCVGYYCETKG